ncbi:F217B protein, partial [Polyodon spathula]|nr:F217B protein [Polyodon spathula]
MCLYISSVTIAKTVYVTQEFCFHRTPRATELKQGVSASTGSNRGRNNEESTGESPGSDRNRPKMSLPLAPGASEPGPLLTERQQVPSIETLQLYEGEAEEADSASDLSDSERLQVPPSPCSPPQLHLRAEVIDPNDLEPHFPGPRGNQSGYSYPDSLPPPFNTWSLRQLALFLNTEGRCAHRPQPVGQLEKYLERLLQLEWLQIQTVEEENGKTTTPASATATAPASRPRPHTAPAWYLSSPKSIRQCQRAFPTAFLSCLGNGSTPRLSRAACPHCQVRYPFCNGSCLSYAYQRHSRLNPVQQRGGGSEAAQKRCSSETRAAVNRGKGAQTQGQKPGSPSPPNSHLRRMQSTGNIRNLILVAGTTAKPQSAPRNGSVGSAAGRNRRQRGPAAGKGGDVESGVLLGTRGNVREGSPLRKGGSERQRASVGVAGQDIKPGCSSVGGKEPPPGSKGPPPRAKSNGKVKRVQFLTMQPLTKRSGFLLHPTT